MWTIALGNGTVDSDLTVSVLDRLKIATGKDWRKGNQKGGNCNSSRPEMRRAGIKEIVGGWSRGRGREVGGAKAAGVALRSDGELEGGRH